ncbi:MAG: serine hydrolase [Pseudomonadales bacterium]|nr:serine hydrolase [Pseudomonadales bacterium]
MSIQEVHGAVAQPFEKVREVFAANFEQQNEVGAAVCVYHQGEKVVDIWGGHRDGAQAEPWQEDTLVNVWSTTKGAMAACISRLVAQGKLELQNPVADYWPEFAAAGKETITVAQLFSHQAGLCGPVEPVTVDDVYDVAGMADRLAGQAPQWEPGTRSGYHAITIGYLAEALVSRVTGQSVGEYFRDQIAGPLGLDVFLGLPEDEEGRVAEMLHDGLPFSGGIETYNEYQILAQVNVPVAFDLANQRRWRAMGIPSAGGTASARGVAGMYNVLIDDVRGNTENIADRKTLSQTLACQITNEDLVIRIPISWGVGFGLDDGTGMYGGGAKSFGHHGWGGSYGFADPEAGLAFSYVMNFMREPQSLDPRAIDLLKACYAAIQS